MHVMQWRREDGVDTDPAYLATGRNGGHQAINLAFHLGASRIVLLAYDMQIVARTHWHDDHPLPCSNPRPATVAGWRDLMATLAAPLADAGVAVINASRATALDCFPRARLEDVLC